jgi:hypothetical protein
VERRKKKQRTKIKAVERETKNSKGIGQHVAGKKREKPVECETKNTLKIVRYLSLCFCFCCNAERGKKR